jgi:hypothetical protein
MDLSVGSLDDPSLLTPTEHWSIETRVENWHADDGLPGHRLDQNVAITKRWKEAYGEDVVPGAVTGRSNR